MDCNWSLIYLIFYSCVNYVPEPEDTALLNSAIRIFLRFDRYPDAAALAVRLNDIDKVKEIFMSCSGRYAFFFFPFVSLFVMGEEKTMPV